MLENRIIHNPAEGKLLWSLILSWSHHVSYIQRYLTDVCRQQQQNLSAARRDNHLLTPSLYLRCHERKSWKLTLAAVSICFHHLHSTNKTQQWIFSLDLSTTVLPPALAHFTNQGPSKKKKKNRTFQFVCLPDSQQPCLMDIWLVYNECSTSLKVYIIWS